jgi:NADPH-dependent glutamate synthase beta subunit-like oxidoreductase
VSAAATPRPTVSARRSARARWVTQLDIRPQPPEKEDKLAVWPYWATKMRTSSSQAEGAQREFQVATLEFVGENGILTHVKCCEVDERPASRSRVPSF